MMGYPEPTRNERVPMPTRCIDCSTVSAIARMPVPRAATDGMRQSCCNRSVKLRACLSTYRSNFVKLMSNDKHLVYPANPVILSLTHFKQPIARLLLAPLKPRTNQSLRKRALKLFPHTRLLITCALNITLHKRIPICRYRDRTNTLSFKLRFTAPRERMHTRRIYIPRRRQSVAWQTRSIVIISAIINAIKVIKIRFDNGAEPVEIEVRVTRHHRIPRPLD